MTKVQIIALIDIMRTAFSRPDRTCRCGQRPFARASRLYRSRRTGSPDWRWDAQLPPRADSRNVLCHARAQRSHHDLRLSVHDRSGVQRRSRPNLILLGPAARRVLTLRRASREHRNLKFLNELAASNDRNFKFTALGRAATDRRRRILRPPSLRGSIIAVSRRVLERPAAAPAAVLVADQ
jgi:hypothetical protein